MIKPTEITERVVKVIGNNHRQVDQFIEEAAECIVAARHWVRGRPEADEKFLRELAQLELMMEQMVVIMGDWSRHYIEEAARLDKRAGHHGMTTRNDLCGLD